MTRRSPGTEKPPINVHVNPLFEFPHTHEIREEGRKAVRWIILTLLLLLLSPKKTRTCNSFYIKQRVVYNLILHYYIGIRKRNEIFVWYMYMVYMVNIIIPSICFYCRNKLSAILSEIKNISGPRHCCNAENFSRGLGRKKELQTTLRKERKIDDYDHRVMRGMKIIVVFSR